MAALEADLAAEPQAGESSCTKISECLYSAGFQLMSWSIVRTCCEMLPMYACAFDLVSVTGCIQSALLCGYTPCLSSSGVKFVLAYYSQAGVCALN